MSKAVQLKRAVDEARVYVGKIGRAERHFRDSIGGRIHRVEITTEIAHQENPGDQNYWKNASFDDALERVVMADFKTLAEKALALLEQDYATARISEKADLLAQLAEIEALEATQAGAA